MPSTWTFHSAGEIVFGCDAVGKLGSVAEEHGIRRMMVVTDSALPPGFRPGGPDPGVRGDGQRGTLKRRSRNHE
jgi:hypothetical protein